VRDLAEFGHEETPPRHQALLGDALAVKLCFAFHQSAKQSFASTNVPKPELGHEESTPRHQALLGGALA